MKPEGRKTKYSLIAVAAVLLALLAQPALATGVTTQWKGPNPNTLWNNPNNWDSGVPGADDIAFLRSTTGSKTATLNVATPALGSVIVDAFSVPGTFTLNQSSGSTSLSATAETIGDLGTAVYNQSAGSNTVGGSSAFLAPDTIAKTLVLGLGSTGNGTYNKSGGSLTAGALIVGLSGTGLFNQSSGNVTIGAVNPDPGQPFSLIIGGEYNNGTPILTGTGTYKMSSGNLTVGSGEVVGQGGTGTFTQSAGTHTVNGLLSVGNQTGSTGTFTMSSGTLKVTGDEYIGASGTGTFTQSSGSHTIGGEFDVGRNGTSNGTFKMSSGSLSVGGNAFIGYYGPGSFTQTSGSVNIKGNLSIADQAGVIGSYSMTSGSLSVGGNEIIGNNGQATFTQTSGSNTAQTITLAAQPGSTGTYNLTSGSVTAPGGFTINGPYTPTSMTNPVSTTGGNFLVNGGGTVNAPVTNNGLIKTTNANVTWNGTVTNNSAYISDPGSTQTFNKDLVVSDTGFLKATAPLTMAGASQDIFIFKENFQITNTNNTNQTNNWDTHNAAMTFVTGGDTTHDLYLVGQDLGRTPTRPVLYSWNSMDITGQTIDLKNGTANTSATLYVGALLGVTFDGSGKINDIVGGPAGHPLYLYYDSTNPLNKYLLTGGVTPTDYLFANGSGGLYWDPPPGVPLPPSVLLLGSGLLGLGALGWRRKRQGV